ASRLPLPAGLRDGGRPEAGGADPDPGPGLPRAGRGPRAAAGADSPAERPRPALELLAASLETAPRQITPQAVDCIPICRQISSQTVDCIPICRQIRRKEVDGTA